MSPESRSCRPANAPSLVTVHQVATRLDVPELTGPIREPTSWLGWLAEAFSSTPQRFHHLLEVWQRAVDVRRADLPWLTPGMADRLELAALLHDVGRAIDPGNSEPHGFVGARFLGACGLDDVARLVAHHSGAQLEAAARGMTDLDRWITIEPDLLHVLTFLDRTTSPSGERVSLAQRRDDIAVRYGANSRQLGIFDATLPDVHRAQTLLARHAYAR